MGLSLQGIDKLVGGEVHLKDINLELESGSRYVVLGHTLAGKTSLLRLIAGLDKPTKGRILQDGADVTKVPVRKRNVAMVYQQFINYPSLTVYDNIASPLKLAGIDKNEIDKRVKDSAAVLKLNNLLDRLPSELSGGQQQRTAIARALVKDSDLLLLDEPLVNLDYKLRESLREELTEIFMQKDAIVVYTTTEPSEALMLGGNIIVMDEGRILQNGPTPKVYHNPGTMKAAEVFSDPPINRICGSVSGNKLTLGSQMTFPLTGHLKGIPEGAYTIGVRSNHLSLKRLNESDIEIKGVCELAEINGSETFVHMNYDGSGIVVQEDGIHPRRIGHQISVFANPGYFFIFDKNQKLVASPAAR